MSECKIWVDNYVGEYYPGNPIQGRVIITLHSQTNLRAVKVKLICKEHTEFMGTESYTEPSTNEQRTRDVLYQGDNEPMVNEIILYGGHGSTTHLAAGQHIYPFSYVLPKNIPGSFDCEFGSIQYKLKATVDRPMAFDYQDEVIVRVMSPIDLNQLGRTDLLQPVSFSEDKTLCCWCCAQGPISLDVEIPKKSLVPGETVEISCRLTNQSNTNIDGIQLKFKQVISCHVNEPSGDSRTISNDLLHLNEVGLGAHGEHTFTFPISLPMDCPTPNFALCKLFYIEYTYEIVVNIPGMHENMTVSMNPIVGNIAYGQSAAEFINPAPVQQPVISYPPPNNGGGGYPAPPQNGGYPAPMPPYPAGTNMPAGAGYPPAQYPAGTGGYPPQQPTGGYPPQQPTGGYQPQPTAGGYPPQQPTGVYPPQQPIGGYQPQQPTGGYPPQQPAMGFSAGGSPSYPPQSAPPVGGVQVFPPSAPSGDNNPKAQEAAATMPYYGGNGSSTHQEQAPPSYDTVNKH